MCSVMQDLTQTGSPKRTQTRSQIHRIQNVNIFASNEYE